MVVVIQNDPLVPPGLISAYLDALGLEWRCCRADRNENTPEADAVIILGGTMGVDDEREFPYLRQVKTHIDRWLEQELPMLGICLGGQLLAQAGGGEVRSASHGEHGVVLVEQTESGRTDPLFCGLPERMPVFQWHNDSFLVPPKGKHLSTSPSCPAQAFRLGNAWGLQFHPEVDYAIVKRWGDLLPGAEPYIQQFLSCADEITDLTQKLLGNFLAMVSTR